MPRNRSRLPLKFGAEEGSSFLAFIDGELMALPPRSVQSLVVGTWEGQRPASLFPSSALTRAAAAAEFPPPFPPFETLLAGTGQEWQPEGEHSRSRSHGSLGDVSYPATTHHYLARIMDRGMGKCSLVILVLVGIDWLASVPCGARIPGLLGHPILAISSRCSHGYRIVPNRTYQETDRNSGAAAPEQ